jgi:alkanesulfonate monooxygenase SsuD/methylene tetrahydromethanopterin reductase-like flavin-dependent oxidoreductase (luciferase family)
MEEFHMDVSKGMEFGLYTLGDHIEHSETGHKISEQQRMKEIVDLAKLSEDAGLDIFGVGESHQEHFVATSTPVILGAIASVTQKIKLISASTVLSTSDPVRVYEDFSTVDLLSDGRAEIVAGRGSRYGAYELFGYDLKDYDELFEEKLDLLMQLNKVQQVTWSGQFRAPLQNAELFPKPMKGHIPIWRAVGEHYSSAIQAGRMGVPMHLAALYGASSVFARRVDAYRRAATESGHDAEKLPVAVATMVYIDKDSQTAMRDFFPYVNNTFTKVRGTPFPKDHYAEGSSIKNAMMVGSPQQIIEKILYQHELFGHSRFIAQIDSSGIPFRKVQEMIEMFATTVAPAVRKAIMK